MNGIVYVAGSGSGGTLYAVSETDGQLLWTASMNVGDQSAPAVSEDGVFVSYPCRTYKFAPLTGGSVWHNSTGCSGGGGKTAAYANGNLYVRDDTSPVGTILNATTGNKSGEFGSTAMIPIPALGATRSYFLVGGVLQEGDLLGQNSAWSFSGSGTLVTAPILVKDWVIMASSAGTVFAVDSATGTQVWSGSAGASISGPDEHNVSAPLSGMAAGEGYLLVPAGSRLVAWKLIGP